MVQFIRISTSVLHATERNLGTVALKATTAWLMSMPAYSAPRGGIKAQLRRYFRAGSNFAAAWRILNRNHLHLHRAPIAENHFHTVYDFSVAVRPDEGLVYLSAADGYRKQSKQYIEPVKQYVAVPVWLLKDNTLSPAAKSVVILAIEELALAKNVAGYTPSKTSMIKRAGVPASSFEAAWREAKRAGYLWQERLLDEKTGLFVWQYSVASSLSEVTEYRQQYAMNCEACTVKRKQEAAQGIVTESLQHAQSGAERQEVQQLVEENISVAWLMEHIHTAPLYYTAEDVKAMVQQNDDTVCCSLPTVRIGQQE